MLVKKKICTADELFMLEGNLQEQNRLHPKNNFVSIQNEEHKSSHSGLKRLMSKRRWTRRLGTALFGWKWKKVKKSSSL
jgi:curved DNA-binding protein CbpA